MTTESESKAKRAEGAGESVARRGEDMIEREGRGKAPTTRAPMIQRPDDLPGNQPRAIARE
jgi:hypothetical protein